MSGDTRSLLQLAAPVPQTLSILNGAWRPMSGKVGDLPNAAVARSDAHTVGRSKKEGVIKPKNAFEQLGLSMVESGSDLPEESNFGTVAAQCTAEPGKRCGLTLSCLAAPAHGVLTGAAMVKCGEALGEVGDAMVAWVRDAAPIDDRGRGRGRSR